MAAARRPSLTAIVLLCAAFAGLATAIGQAEALVYDSPLKDHVATRTIRLPTTTTFEKFSPLKGATATVGVRKIRVAPGQEVPEADRELVQTWLAGAHLGLGHLLGLLGFYFGFAYLLLLYMSRAGGARAALLRTQATTLGVLLVMMVAAELFLLNTAASEFLFPAVAPALFAVLYLDRRVAYATVIGVALLVSSLVRFDVQVLLVLLAQGAVCLSLVRSSKLQNILGAAAAGGAAGVGAFVLSSLAMSGRVAFQFGSFTGDFYAAFAGPVLGGMLALVAVAPLERLFGTVSRQRLAELGEFNHPLLKDLREKAPGTWAHSIAMANLAEEAADAIGANGRLCRVAAYYHDIGKMLNPRFFTENQRGGENPHDGLPPGESAEIIINHVVDGAKLAARHNIPPVVADFIPMHHGSSLIEYFYEKALDEGTTAGVSREEFVYPGEKPNTKETGIMMIVDAVEATSRSMRELTPKSVERMIEHIVFTKLLYGQLDETGLSLLELKKICLTLVDAILNQRHERVEYPWQRAENGARTTPTPAPASPRPPSQEDLRMDAPRPSGRVAVPAEEPGDAATDAAGDLERADDEAPTAQTMPLRPPGR
ncbi:MAG TPA: HDIG domain-containing protein [Myxococcota bacterium]|jgi:hypothetical protein|nr:HDIG domain-containing protein [Myxococcota bacterium]